MEHLLLHKSRKFNVGGFVLEILFKNRRCFFAGDSIWNAFEEKSEHASDFSFYVESEYPPEVYLNQEEQAKYSQGKLIMNYSGLPEYLVLEMDPETEEITLFQNNESANYNDWFEHLGHLFCWLSLKHNACNLHAVILEYQGNGILLTAPSGTGKSTHAHYWRDCENALIINGDRALLRLIDGKWWACGSPWSGTSGECVNRRVPLSAIVCLKQGPVNMARKLAVREALSKLLPRIIAPKMIPELGELGIDYGIKLAEEIPVFELECQDHPDSVIELKRVLNEYGVLN